MNFFIIFSILVTGLSALSFNSDETFKILQVSDTHFRDAKSPDCEDVDFTPCSYKNTTYFLERSLEKEKPDLVVFSGDLVDWGTDNVNNSLKELLAPVISRKIYWCGILGNHDGQSGIDGGRKAVMEQLTRMPYSLSQMGPEDVSGYGNYVLNITTKNSNTPIYD